MLKTKQWHWLINKNYKIGNEIYIYQRIALFFQRSRQHSRTKLAPTPPDEQHIHQATERTYRRLQLLYERGGRERGWHGEEGWKREMTQEEGPDRPHREVTKHQGGSQITVKNDINKRPISNYRGKPMNWNSCVQVKVNVKKYKRMDVNGGLQKDNKQKCCWSDENKGARAPDKGWKVSNSGGEKWGGEAMEGYINSQTNTTW